jgi:hypothetical protein
MEMPSFFVSCCLFGKGGDAGGCLRRKEGSFSRFFSKFVAFRAIDAKNQVDAGVAFPVMESTGEYISGRE